MLYFIFIIVGISLVLIVSEIKRPRLPKEEKSKYSKVSEEYRKSGYTTYFTSIHTPEFFFVYEDWIYRSYCATCTGHIVPVVNKSLKILKMNRLESRINNIKLVEFN